MQIDRIRFYSTSTRLGEFHKLEIYVDDEEDEEGKYKNTLYWSVAGYSLPNLVDQLIEILQNLHYKDFPDMLRKREEEES